MKILVAMSGGVDSSLVTHMLAEQGHELVGVRLSLWTDTTAPTLAQIQSRKCCDPQTVYRATTVAQTLGIPLHTIDLQHEFKSQVVDPFLREYRAGNTPNPCVICNRTIKFGVLLKIAAEYGCSMLATGHYARIERTQTPEGTLCRLYEAIDTNKSQSYFLYALTQDQLRQSLFPLGTMQKTDVIAQAQKRGIPLPEHYEESQDVCFYPEKEPQEFLKRHMPDAITAGPIYMNDGKRVGTHRGLPLYTTGQRKGLGIGGLKIPLHVVEKSVHDNSLIVAPSGADCKLELAASSLNWIAKPPAMNTVHHLQARISSQGRLHAGTLTHNGTWAVFRFAHPLRGIAPGQSAVFYKGQEILGGGIIQNADTQHVLD
ncbi:tRNA 2-thiouridine(34) synthase MnmA [Candidatus Peribacteria bacterium]|nr:tRNA 2-thiouridine(34) synthase MnmA [Candidatus Peribacteria bacterium]